MFSQDTFSTIADMAEKEGFEAAALLAVAHLESGGAIMSCCAAARSP